jgi:hypothetical protein
MYFILVPEVVKHIRLCYMTKQLLWQGNMVLVWSELRVELDIFFVNIQGDVLSKVANVIGCSNAILPRIYVLLANRIRDTPHLSNELESERRSDVVGYLVNEFKY